MDRGRLSPVGPRRFISADLNNSPYTRKQIRAEVDTCCLMYFQLEFPSLLRGQLEATPQEKISQVPDGCYRVVFTYTSPCYQKQFFSKMHVLHSFSVVKSGEIIRHNYSLHLLCGRSCFKYAEGLAEPAAQQILYPPHLLLCKHMPLKKDSNSITTLKQQQGSKAPWPRLTQPECIAIFIPRAARIEGT